MEISIEKSAEAIKALLSNNDTKEKIIAFAEAYNIDMIDFGISVRSYNALRRHNVWFLHEAIRYYPDGFDSFRNIGRKSIDEICGIIENYVLEHIEQINAYLDGAEIKLVLPANVEQETDPLKLTTLELIKHPLFKDKAEEYIKENNIPVEQMGLGVRSVNAFVRANIFSFLDALAIYPNNLSTLKNIGAKSVDEIKCRMEHYLADMQEAVSAYCSGDTSALYSDEFVRDTVTSCFKDTGFTGISFEQIIEAFPDEFDEARINECINDLLNDKHIKYVDSNLCRVYPSVYLVLEESSLQEEEKALIYKKFSGMTLDAIAQENGVSRERIRQKFDKYFKKLSDEMYAKYGFRIFDEDYYSYLFSNYEVAKEMWLDFIGVSDNTFGYLVNLYSKGKSQIADALSDPEIDVLLKYKIQDYLNRNKLLIDGKLIEKQRSDLEDYALSKLARDELSYDEFSGLYNNLLAENGIDFDEKLYYTDEVKGTRKNRLAESMCCLWKSGERIRYYDISAHDYEELLDTINLESFENVEISTLKIFNEYPDVMAKHDIRDQYELHNLLKKVVDCQNYNAMSFGRQPMIQFGTFDRTQAIYDIIVANSPITSDDLAEYVYLEYGYDKTTAAASYFQPLNKYFHQGVYSVEFKHIPLDRIDALKTALPDEFYYISEIKDVYKNLFEGADPEEINPRSLKALGYTVLASYALKSHSTSDAYFRELLNANEVFSVKELNKRYGYLGAYSVALCEMRRNYDILNINNEQCIHFRKLEKLGITKEDIKEYCDLVYSLVDNNQYFTIRSLQKFDISTKLMNLGFGEIFLAGILAMSTKFLHTHIFGTLVLYKGESTSGISKKSFILSLLSNYNDVSIEQIKADCFDLFGVKIPERYEITSAIANTDFYYDPILDKVYRDKSVY